MNNQDFLADFFTPNDISYYTDILPKPDNGQITLTLSLTPEQCAAALQVFDYGLDSITEEAKPLLEQLAGVIKQAVKP